jgi:hypothetical protein
VVKDLRLDAGRAGPAAGVYFALNMALYTERGTVHTTRAVDGWLRAAGLRVSHLRLACSPASLVAVGRRS